ncbi:hypothetical protein [Pacificibacter marinus]|uniref:hypothetical protein n=1 Tax=Pacificibacter marinus TaxID=658057 RepID=UPI0008AF2341|nr:hypothetical protein [Pacificibacter marinus]SEK54560.1 hypothetical protein SAMN04488032_103254 [Pacificibacter marinus]
MRRRSDLLGLPQVSLGVGAIGVLCLFMTSVLFSRSFGESFVLSPRVLRVARRALPLVFPFRGRAGCVLASLLVALCGRVLWGVHVWRCVLRVSCLCARLAVGFVLCVRAALVYWGFIMAGELPALFVPSGSVVGMGAVRQAGGDGFVRFIVYGGGADRFLMWMAFAVVLDRLGAGRLFSSFFGLGVGGGFGVRVFCGGVHVLVVEALAVFVVFILVIGA